MEDLVQRCRAGRYPLYMLDENDENILRVCCVVGRKLVAGRAAR